VDAVSYYTDLTQSLTKYSCGTAGWHYGLWEEGVSTHAEAVHQANERVVAGVQIGTETRVLDVGCGVGGFAVWAAKRFGCQVTGITNCSNHLPVARLRAAVHGVSSHCQFHAMDMSRLAFPDDGFDLVVNQDSFCYAVDKRRYIESVYQNLKCGGYWRAVAFGIRERPLSSAQTEEYEIVRQGFHIPSLLPASVIQRWLGAVGFVNCEAVDVTRLVLPTARRLVRRSRIPVWLSRLGLERMIFPGEASRRRNLKGHYLAGMAYSRGLLRGYFRHCFYSGSKP
jgi:tocopherol O-methyltransferase